MKISFTGGIRLNSGNGAEHMLLLTPTRKGKRMLIKAEAERLGISYEEMECRLEPTPEQKEKARMRKEEKHRRDAARLDAVRKAYWDNTDKPDSDLSPLVSALEGIVTDIVGSWVLLIHPAKKLKIVSGAIQFHIGIRILIMVHLTNFEI